MRLIPIVTRLVPAWKVKITQKLMDRVCSEPSVANCATSAERRRPERRGFGRSHGAAVLAAVTVAICLATKCPATGAQPGERDGVASGYSAAGLFNQANAYARAGRPGLAILNYERAGLLAPDDADIAANLQFVRVKAGLPDPREPWFSHSLTYARPSTLTWLGSFGLVLVGMSVVLVRLLPQRRLAFRSMAFVGALLFAGAVGSAITLWPRLKEAVVIAREAPARISPVSVAEPAFKLREGETVTVRAEHRSFELVRTSGGRSGWVVRGDLALVIPRSSNRPQ